MIVASRSGNRRTVSARAAGLSDLLTSAGIAYRGSGTTTPTETGLVGLPAANLAIRIASTAIAELELAVYRGLDEQRRLVRTTWQARLFAGQPNAYEAWSLLLEQTESSLTARSSAFWRLDFDPSTRRVVGVHFLHPDAVEARWSKTEDRPEYRYRTVGGWSEWSSTSILHFRTGYPEPGCIIPKTPVELARDSVGSWIAKPKHSRTTFEKGAPRQLAVMLDREVDPEKAERFRTIYERSLTGAESAGGVRVFGGGATVETIGLTMADAQWVESMQLDAEQIGQLFGVPASLLGVSKSGDRPLSPEHEETRWDRYYLGPRRTRIEDAIRTHPLLFGSSSRDRPSFVPRPVRSDVITTARALTSLVQAGIMLPDDARAELGLEPLEDGLGQIPQIVPVGGSPFGVLDPSGDTTTLADDGVVE